MNKSILFIGMLASIALLMQCTKDPKIEDTLTPYTIEAPQFFPEMYIHPDNPLTKEGIELGRKLYYDKIVHVNNQFSCSSCHIQSSSFTTFASNSLQHINLGYGTNFLWKGGVQGTMEDIMDFEVEDFFNCNPEKLNNHPEYPALFKKVFGINTITNKEIAYALAQFTRTLISSDSKWDKYLRKEVQLSYQEMQGMELYFSEKGDCFHCHGTMMLSDNDFHNTGLDANPEDGRKEVTGLAEDLGKFKTPTLRNIELTAPYMHDGRFETLEEVIDFYSEELQYSETISPLMKQVHLGGVRLSVQEKADLIAFLKTFTDESFLTNPELSNPN